MTVNSKIKFQLPNLLLIAGNGRNVGKTTLACQIISKLSKNTELTAIKISSHFHSYSGEAIFEKENRFVILEENQISAKDSSLMLQAGARRVFYIMAEQENLGEAMECLLPLLGKNPVVCESGGLHQWVQPGLFLFVNETGRELSKTEHLQHQPRIVNNNGTNFDFEIDSIRFSETGIRI